MVTSMHDVTPLSASCADMRTYTALLKQPRTLSGQRIRSRITEFVIHGLATATMLHDSNYISTGSTERMEDGIVGTMQ